MICLLIVTYYCLKQWLTVADPALAVFSPGKGDLFLLVTLQSLYSWRMSSAYHSKYLKYKTAKMYSQFHIFSS